MRTLVADQLDVEQEAVHVDSAFADLGATDDDRLAIAMAFDELFDVYVPDEDIASLRTFGDAVA